MTLTDKRIKEYKEAFFKVHERIPIIEKRGAWIKIEDSFTSFRASQLPSLTNILLDRYRKRQTRIEKLKIANEEANRIKDNEIKVPYVIQRNETWGQYIKQNSIEFFLNSLFEKCNHSLYQMQNWLDDFAFGDMPIIENKQAWDRYLTFQEENEKLVDRNEDLKDKVEYLENLISNYKSNGNKKLKMIESLKEKIKHLEKNSVIFSMDDN
jgi:hypothetical protein